MSGSLVPCASSICPAGRCCWTAPSKDVITAEHSMQVEELPDVIPEELYVQQLDSAEEQALFEQLKASHPADVDSDQSPAALEASGMLRVVS